MSDDPVEFLLLRNKRSVLRQMADLNTAEAGMNLYMGPGLRQIPPEAPPPVPPEFQPLANPAPKEETFTFPEFHVSGVVKVPTAQVAGWKSVRRMIKIFLEAEHRILDTKQVYDHPEWIFEAASISGVFSTLTALGILRRYNGGNYSLVSAAKARAFLNLL